MNPRRLPLASFAVLASTSALASGSATTMEQWRDYAASAMAPSFDWYQPGQTAPTLLDQVRAARAAQDSQWLGGLQPRFDGVALGSDHGAQSSDYQAFALDSEFSGRGVSASFAGTRLSLIGSGLGDFGISAIVARQQFATQGFGAGEWDGSYGHYRHSNSGAHESSSGSGVRFDVRSGLPQGVYFDVAVQSRIEMDAFKTYRGVYSEAGDFDIPGFAKFAVSAPMGGRLTLGAEVQRIFYREIDTFTSSALPSRFLALLGDGTSPEFAWRDLTVYAIEARLADDHHGSWTLRFASQQQPQPTSELLDRALEELYSDTNVALSYQFERERVGQFRIAASYSPVTYFLGSSAYVRRGFETGSQLEFEAQWTVPF